jgi:hypothetical protein
MKSDNMKSDKMNVSEFARKIGVSHTAIQKAIAAGKITAITPDRKIIYEQALKEARNWGIVKIDPEVEMPIEEKKHFGDLFIQMFYGEVGAIMAKITLDHEDVLRNLYDQANTPEWFFDAMQERFNDFLDERKPEFIEKMKQALKW